MNICTISNNNLKSQTILGMLQRFTILTQHTTSGHSVFFYTALCLCNGYGFYCYLQNILCLSISNFSRDLSYNRISYIHEDAFVGLSALEDL